MAEFEHGAATIDRDPAGGWRVECHDCSWSASGLVSDTAAEKAWYGHAGPVPDQSREQLVVVGCQP